ncbi:Stigma-specific STIG protein 3 [Spatholobus suberectus]|nr:Stigma-specific STIG protein 3 [Spatholobus suberectus]
MGFLKAIFIIAITLALSIALTMKSHTQEEAKPAFGHHDLPSSQPSPLTHHQKKVLLPSKRVNRFLAQKVKNPNAADHCHKDHDICSLSGVTNSTCCNNKCIDMGYDDHNCGTCKKKCKFTETCCRGECVDIYFDKRHCGECNHRCERGEYCVYGMCGYA